MNVLTIVLLVLLAIVALIFIVLYLIGSRYTHEDEVTVEIDAPVETTFAVFTDVDNMAKWMDSPTMAFKGIENISGRENEIGSKWKLIFEDRRRKRETVMIETITDFKENERFAFNLDNKMIDFDLDIRFEGENGKSRISEKLTGKGKSPIMNAMLKMMKRKSNIEKQEMYNRLKALVEKKHNET